MPDESLNLTVERLGEGRIPSPMPGVRFVSDQDKVLYQQGLKEIEAILTAGREAPAFEMAGPREKLYFDPAKLKCGIVTCGGLCPGLNDVIRAVVLCLFRHYRVQDVLGFRYGYEGLSRQSAHPPMELNPEVVAAIQERGGTILGTSRGPQDVADMVDTLEHLNIGILFAIGGDGTLRGAQAISQEIGRRHLKIAVIGIPKTIDNDVSFIDWTFGFETAVSEARIAIYAAHTEASAARNGIGLVKLMGRESGFIATHATLASSQVDFCLIPEFSFSLEGFLAALRRRLESRRHVVIVTGEGAGQDLMGESQERDASGNIRFGDIGIFLRDQINAYFKQAGIKVTLKYIDPSYTIRSVPANPHDSAFCLLLGYDAVHAGLAGRTNMVVGSWKRNFTHVPIGLAVSRRKRIDLNGRLWNDVLAVTEQPREM
ncbi:MAG: ATP-dependent 6-phosphofructokinase [Syntrophobacterales bacterium]|jgi:6-phosphofructokinase 1